MPSITHRWVKCKGGLCRDQPVNIHFCLKSGIFTWKSVVIDSLLESAVDIGGAAAGFSFQPRKAFGILSHADVCNWILQKLPVHICLARLCELSQNIVWCHLRRTKTKTWQRAPQVTHSKSRIVMCFLSGPRAEQQDPLWSEGSSVGAVSMATSCDISLNGRGLCCCYGCLWGRAAAVIISDCGWCNFTYQPQQSDPAAQMLSQARTLLLSQMWTPGFYIRLDIHLRCRPQGCRDSLPTRQPASIA